MYARIIVAVDIAETTQAHALLEDARALLDAGGEIRLVHVLEDVPGYLLANLPPDLTERRRAEAMVELRAMIDPARDTRVVPDLRRGEAAAQIIEAAVDSGADLIMIASHKPGLRDYLIGSTAGRVIRHAGCSVLVKR